MSHENTEIPLRLVRLISSLLPVGSFAYSRGLEHAVQAGWVSDIASLEDWLFGTLEHSFASLDGAVFLRMMGALETWDTAEFHRLDAFLSAGRESRELLLEDRRMAQSLKSLLREMEVAPAIDEAWECQTFTAAFALAAHNIAVRPVAGLHGLMWSLCEAQVAAAMRLGVIGQADGQRILAAAPARITECADAARNARDDEMGNLSFMQAVGSALHETQYSRLFRS